MRLKFVMAVAAFSSIPLAATGLAVRHAGMATLRPLDPWSASQAPSSPTASTPPVSQGTDLDAFMETVLKRRDDNWTKLRQYVLDEREAFDLNGPGGTRLYGFRRDYTWFIRQGFFVRSPVRADGVAVSEADRREAEEDWIRRERRREQRRIRQDAAPEEAEGSPAAAAGPAADVLGHVVEPRFVSAAYFLRFRFEQGRYALAGRETLDGRSVLKIEYYPQELFREGRTRPNRRLRERDPAIEEKMNKVSLVTLWIDAETRHILQYTFDDIDMDFLPARALVRVDDLKATMRMGEVFPSVWLPRSIAVRFGMTLATGAVNGEYTVDYHDYREASVTYEVR
jgi:hypothetical protein